VDELLKQIFVVSPNGPCFINKNYDKSEKDVDPQLISAVVSLGSSGKVSMSEIKRILKQEMLTEPNSNIEIITNHNYISCAITSNNTSVKIREMLRQINQLTYETMGNPNSIAALEYQKMDKMESRIDLILSKNGYING